MLVKKLANLNLNRYRYLQRVATFDRALVDRIGELENQVVELRDMLRLIYDNPEIVKQLKEGNKERK